MSTTPRSSYSRSTSGATSSLSSENLPPRRVARELRDLFKNPVEGTRLIVDSDSGLPSTLSEISAEIQGPTGTPYESKYFQLKLVLPSDYPHSPPRGFFLTKIYHPNVDMSTGAICVNTLKKDWTPSVTLSHVLSVIRCLLIVPFPESSLNDEAGKLFMESYDEYARRAKLMAEVHGRPHSYIEKHISPPCSPNKSSKENTVTDSFGKEVKSTSGNVDSAVKPPVSSVLKQSNTGGVKKTDRSKSRGSPVKSSSKKAADKKTKKKSLRRL